MKQKGFAPILIVVILAMVGIAVAYYFGTQKGNVLPTLTQTPVPGVTKTPTQISPTTKPTADPAATWKTYTGGLNYVIKVPPQFGLDERGLPNLHFSLITASTPPAGLLDMFIDTPSQCTTESQCLNSLITSYQGAQSAGSKAQFTQISTTIAGKVANGIEYWDPGINEGGTVIPSSLIYEYFTSNGGKVLDFQFVINKYQNIGEARTQKPLVDQILSTFKFTQ